MPTKPKQITLDDLKRSGLTKADAERMHIVDYTAEEMSEFFKGCSVSAYAIPYLDFSGNPEPYGRYRLHKETRLKAGEKPVRYLQIPGSKPRFYMPPYTDWNAVARDPAIEVYITEGEKKGAALDKLGYPTIALGGVWNWRKSDDDVSSPIVDFQKLNWQKRRVTIVFDSDAAFNDNIKKAISGLRDHLIDLGANPYIIDLPHDYISGKTGIDDFLQAAGRAAKNQFKALPRKPLLLRETFTATELMKQKFLPPQWVVPGLIPVGLTVFAGAPKVGKSWLVLSILAAVTTGTKALGHFSTTPIEGLYLALEDSAARLKSRLEQITEGSARVGDGAHFETEWPRVEDRGLLALERWLQDHPKCKVVFIDTLARMREAPTGRGNLYHEDYEAMVALKALADKNKVGIVVVHHTRKQKSDDVFEQISGSTGITGAADTSIVLLRNRNDLQGTLHVTGRDVRELQLAMTFDNGLWTVIGDAVDVDISAARRAILDILVEAGEPMGPSQISSVMGRKPGSLHMTLMRMVRDGILLKAEKGKYYPVPENKTLDRPKYTR